MKSFLLHHSTIGEEDTRELMMERPLLNLWPFPKGPFCPCRKACYYKVKCCLKAFLINIIHYVMDQVLSINCGGTKIT